MPASPARLRLLTAALFACASVTCGDDQPILPSAPSILTTGIVVFDGANFTGGSAHILGDISDLSKYKGPCERESGGDYASYSNEWDDCVSSIRVSPNVRAIVYVDTNFKGWGVTIDDSVPNLEFVLGPCRRGSVDNCISSIRVTSR